MTLDEELATLGVRIRQLRIQFDLFFSGATPKPPLEARDDLDRQIKRLGTFRDMKLAQRFLYNTTLHRWNVFSELWSKRIQAREEGTRTPAPLRRRAGAPASAPSREAPSSSPPPRPEAPAKGLLARACIRDATDSALELQAFYRAFLEARQDSGGGKAPSYERFCKEIERQAAAIRQKSSCDRVDFRLYLKDSRVTLKAKPLK